jgi:hypothetical protein
MDVQRLADDPKFPILFETYGGTGATITRSVQSISATFTFYFRIRASRRMSFVAIRVDRHLCEIPLIIGGTTGEFHIIPNVIDPAPITE